MKTLYLLRHAKSSWADGTLADHERPLARRGEEATRALAGYVADAGIAPAVVLCSTAVRARQTLAGVSSWGGENVDVLYEEALYGATGDELLARLRRVPPATPTAMVVAHNPGLEDLTLSLVGAGDEDALASLHAKFPTGALATLLVPCPWQQLAPGQATLAAFVVPRDLDTGHA